MTKLWWDQEQDAPVMDLPRALSVHLQRRLTSPWVDGDLRCTAKVATAQSGLYGFCS